MRLALPLLALIAGCDSFDGQSDALELVLEQTRYAPGDEVIVVLDNDTGREATYSPCLLLLGPDSRQTAADLPICAAIAATIQPGQSIPLRFQLPADLEAGRYVLALDDGLALGRGRTRAVLSGRFEVVAAG